MHSFWFDSGPLVRTVVVVLNRLGNRLVDGIQWRAAYDLHGVLCAIETRRRIISLTRLLTITLISL